MDRKYKKRKLVTFCFGTLCKTSIYVQRQNTWWINPTTTSTTTSKALAKIPCGGGDKCPGKYLCPRGPGCTGCHLCDPSHPGSRMKQIAAALAATLGALATGITQGTSDVQGGSTIQVSSGQQGYLMDSAGTLGAAFVCFPIGYIMDILGRRKTMILLAVPFTFGWIIINTAKNVNMIIAGRFITGVAGGAFYVTVPTYTSEIAQSHTRGALGTLFQLMISIGLLLSYGVGGAVSITYFNIFCAGLPIVFCIGFFYMPESPSFLVARHRYDEARVALTRLRGKEFNVEREVQRLIRVKELENKQKGHCLRDLSQRTSRRAMVICFSLMLFQQYSGLHAVSPSATIIFAESGADIPYNTVIIIVAVFNVVGGFITSLFVEKIGRRILLLLSAMIMCVNNLMLAFYYFFFSVLGSQHEFVKGITWLPLSSLIQFFIAFSLGFGPIPWIMAGELCRMNVKAFVTSAAGTLSWLLSFAGASTFHIISQEVGMANLYLAYSIIMLGAFFFIFYWVPETKGKTVAEIEEMLDGPLKPVVSHIHIPPIPALHPVPATRHVT